MVSMTCWKIADATLIPKASLIYLYKLLWVLIQSNLELSSSTSIRRYASERSILEIFPPFNLLKFSSGIGRGSCKASFNPVEKSAQIRIWLDFFFTWTVGAAHSLQFVFYRIPACSSLSNSLLIYSRTAKGPFRFFLNTGCAPSFTLSLAFNLGYFPRPPEKKPGEIVEFLFEIYRIGRCTFYFATKCTHWAIP